MVKGAPRACGEDAQADGFGLQISPASLAGNPSRPDAINNQAVAVRFFIAATFLTVRRASEDLAMSKPLSRVAVVRIRYALVAGLFGLALSAGQADVHAAQDTSAAGGKAVKDGKWVLADGADVYLKARADGVVGRGRPANHADKPTQATEAENACVGP